MAIGKEDLRQCVARHDIHTVNALAEDHSLVINPEIRDEGVREAFDAYKDVIGNVGLPQEEVDRTIDRHRKILETRAHKRQGIIAFAKTVDLLSKGE